MEVKFFFVEMPQNFTHEHNYFPLKMAIMFMYVQLHLPISYICRLIGPEVELFHGRADWKSKLMENGARSVTVTLT